jgi:hypothetical protein
LISHHQDDMSIGIAGEDAARSQVALWDGRYGAPGTNRAELNLPCQATLNRSMRSESRYEKSSETDVDS